MEWWLLHLFVTIASQRRRFSCKDAGAIPKCVVELCTRLGHRCATGRSVECEESTAPITLHSEHGISNLNLNRHKSCVSCSKFDARCTSATDERSRPPLGLNSHTHSRTRAARCPWESMSSSTAISSTITDHAACHKRVHTGSKRWTFPDQPRSPPDRFPRPHAERRSGDDGCADEFGWCPEQRKRKWWWWWCEWRRR